MKIIRDGRLPETLTGHCQRCGCVVECEEYEATWEKVGDQSKGEFGGGFWTVKCPTPRCKSTIRLEEKR